MTVELTAIFATVALFVALSAVIVRICLPRTCAEVSADAYYAARDVSWAVDDLSMDKARDAVRSQKRRYGHVRPRKVKKALDPLADLNIILRK